jgi:site-specific DNA recombinase
VPARWFAFQDELETTERRLADITDQLVALDRDTVDVAEVRSALEHFDPVWEVLTTRDQERLIRLVVGKVTYDGRTGKVGVTFKGAGAKGLYQGNHQ